MSEKCPEICNLKRRETKSQRQIQKFVQNHQIQASSIPFQQKVERIMDQPSHTLTFEWYTQGMTIEEIAKKRKLSKITIQKHIIRSIEEGNEINWNELFDEATEKRILNTIREMETDKLKPIWEALHAEIDYFVIQAVLCKNQLSLK